MPTSLEAGFVLTDPRDPRFQYIKSLRRRYGEFLHKASLYLQPQQEEDNTDAVHSLVGYLLEFVSR